MWQLPLSKARMWQLPLSKARMWQLPLSKARMWQLPLSKARMWQLSTADITEQKTSLPFDIWCVTAITPHENMKWRVALKQVNGVIVILKIRDWGSFDVSMLKTGDKGRFKVLKTRDWGHFNTENMGLGSFQCWQQGSGVISMLKTWEWGHFTTENRGMGH